MGRKPSSAAERRQTATGRRRLLVVVAAVSVALLAGVVLVAHDIPNDVTVHAYVKPDGSRLRMLVRVPLAAMRDIDYPKRGAINSGMLDLARADSTLRDAAMLWIGDFLDVYENDRKLPAPTVATVRASLQSDPSFASYDAALAHVAGPPLPNDTEFVWSQGLLDVQFQTPIQSERSRFSIAPRFARLGIRTLTIVRFVAADGTVRAFELQGDPGIVRLDPTFIETVQQFVRLGVRHATGGAEYALFLVCLLMPIVRARALVAIVASFAAAHSVTLIASAYGLAPDMLWFPPLITTLIAVSIVYAAAENIVRAALQGTQSMQSTQSEFLSDRSPRAPSQSFSASSASSAFHRHSQIAFAFGLAYGFAFSFALRQSLQFAGSHVAAAVLAFNVGIEIGVILLALLLAVALRLAFRYVFDERVGTVVLSALVGHTAWHWMGARWSVLRQFRVEWPAFDLAFWAAAMRWAMLAVALVGVYWLVGLLRPLISSRAQPRSSQR